MSSTRHPATGDRASGLGWEAGFEGVTRENLEALAATDLDGVVEVPRLLSADGSWVSFVAREPCCDAKVLLAIRARSSLDEAVIEDVLAAAAEQRAIVQPAAIPVRRFGFTDELLWVTTRHHPGRLLEHWYGGGRTRGPGGAFDFLREVVDPLDDLHAAGLVHGALSTSSFHRDTEGVVRVRHLGLDLALLRCDVANGLHTEAVACAAPEVRAGRVPVPASDQYAVAALFVRILTGAFPPPDRAALDGVPPGEMRSALRRALLPDPEARFPSVRALWLALGGSQAEPEEVALEETGLDTGAEPYVPSAFRSRRGPQRRPAFAPPGEVDPALPADAPWEPEPWDVPLWDGGPPPNDVPWGRWLAAAVLLLLGSASLMAMYDLTPEALPDWLPGRTATTTIAPAPSAGRMPASEAVASGSGAEADDPATTPPAEPRTPLVEETTAAPSDSAQAIAAADSEGTPADSESPAVAPAGVSADATPPSEEPAPAPAPAPAPERVAERTPVRPASQASAAVTERNANATAAASVPETAPPEPALAPGSISMQTYPWGAVYVDGEFVGNTPILDLRLSAGPHTIRVERSGYQPYEQEVTVQPGRTLRLTGIVLRSGS